MLSVAFWADSTYGYIDEERISNIAVELDFPLATFTCTHGAGLATKGIESTCRDRTAAPVVIIEMGYNDESQLSKDSAVVGMRKQSWFTALKDQVSTVKRAIFIQQPAYHQVAQKTCRRRGTRKSLADGQLIEGSRWTTEAAQLVWADLKIETVVFDVPAEEIYVGFIRKGVDLWRKAGQ